MAKMDSKKMRQWALSMYLNENRTQEEIAEACGGSNSNLNPPYEGGKGDVSLALKANCECYIPQPPS